MPFDEIWKRRDAELEALEGKLTLQIQVASLRLAEVRGARAELVTLRQLLEERLPATEVSDPAPGAEPARTKTAD